MGTIVFEAAGELIQGERQLFSSYLNPANVDVAKVTSALALQAALEHLLYLNGFWMWESF